MDCSEAQKLLHQIRIDLAQLAQKLPVPDWKKLDYSRSGVKALYEQMKICGSYEDFGQHQLQLLQLRKLEVASWLRTQEVLLQEQISAFHVDKISSWVVKGMAASERHMMAEFQFVGQSKPLKETRLSLESADSVCEVVEKRLQTLSKFRFDFKSLESALRFGHTLQEL